MANFLDDIFGPDPSGSGPAPARGPGPSPEPGPGAGRFVNPLGSTGDIVGQGVGTGTPTGEAQAPGPLAQQIIGSPSDAPADVSALPELGPATTGLGFKNMLDATFKRLWTSDPAELAKSLKDVPGISIQHNKDGDPYAVIKGKQYSLNTKGFSYQDLAPLATALVANIGVGLATEGASIPMQAAAAGAGEGSIMNIGLHLSRGELPGIGELAKETTVGGAAGLVGGLVASKFGGVLSRVGTLLDPSGALTRTARAAIEGIGLDPDNISASVLKRADALLKGRAANPGTLNRAIAEVDTADLGIPLLRGEATGNLSSRYKEVAAQEGNLGNQAAATMRAFTEGDRRRSIGVATENVAQKVAPRATLGEHEYQTGEKIIEGVTAAEKAAKQNVNDAYDLFRQQSTAAGLAIPTDTALPWFTAAKTEITRRISDINPHIAPETFSLMKRLEQDIVPGGHMTPDAIEGYRVMLGDALRDAQGKDKAGIYILKKNFNQWMENEVGAMPGGTSLMATLRDARATAADRFDRFTTDSKKSPSRQLIQNLWDGEVDPEVIINKVLGGKTQFTSSGATIYYRIARALGANTPAEMAAHPILSDIRRQAIKRIIGGSADMQAIDAKGAQAMSSAISKALDGAGARYANTILGHDGTEAMLQLQRQLQRIIRPSQLSNSSRSGFTIIQGVKNSIRNLVGTVAGGGIGSAVGTAIGGPVGTGVGGMAGVMIGGKVAEGMAERAGAKVARRAISAPKISAATQATRDKIGGILGTATAIGLPTTTATMGLGGILQNPWEQR